MAHLTADQWDRIREVWEGDPRPGYAWIVEHLELPVARQRVAKKAKDDGWKKAEKPLHDANLGAPKGKKTNRAESAPKAPGAAASKSSHRPGKRGVDRGKAEGGSGATTPDPNSPKTGKPAGRFKKTEGQERVAPKKRKPRARVAQPESNESNTDSHSQWHGRTEIDTVRAPFGRPPEFKQEYVELAFKQCLLYGATDEQLAKFFGVSDRTIYRWKVEYPDFCHALKAGKSVADGNVAYGLYQRACGMKLPKVHVSNYQGHITLTDIFEVIPPDPGAARTWLFNRQSEHWKAEPEPPAADPSSLFPSEEELDQIYSASRVQTARKAQEARERRDRLGICSTQNTIPVDATIMPARKVAPRSDHLAPADADDEGGT